MPGGKTKNTRRLGTLNTSKEKHINIEVSEFEERYHEIVDIIRKTAARKGNEIHVTRKKTQKNKSKKRKPQQQKMKAHLQKPKHKGPKEKSGRAAAQK